MTKIVENWEVFVYILAALVSVVLLLAITAVASNSADLFPSPRPEELLQTVQWVRDGSFLGGTRPSKAPHEEEDNPCPG
jgi:hypothetical protein